MALDAEEFRKRRKKRQQQREKQLAKQRKMLLTIAAAAGFLILCAAVIFGLSSGDQTPDVPVTENTAPSLNTEQAETSATDPTTVIHFAMAGDLNITDNVVSSGSTAYDYTNAFLDVAHLLADADITAINFEGNLLGAPFGSKTASAPQSMMQALSDAGVDLVQLANSYAISDGIGGLNSTINGVRNAGMIPLGVYGSNAEYEKQGGYTIMDVRGVRVAFVAFTKGMDGMALPAGSENCVNVLYADYDSTYQQVDTEGIKALLQRVEKASPDVTVALLHWGSEFNDTISSSQEKICDLMLEGGVDAIIGTHSHYVQKMEYDPEAGTFVAYSLGDFFGDAQRAGSEYSVILDLEITKDNDTGKTRITNFSYTPIFTVAEENKPLRVVRIHEAMIAFEGSFMEKVSRQTYDAMAYALKRIEARTTGE